MGGDFYKDPKGNADAYQNDARKKSKTGSKYFRNFNRTKQKAFMTTFDDTQFLYVHLCIMANVTAGNPQTALNNLVDKCWELGAKTGNIKDLDATQEANFKTWIQHWLRLVWDIAAQLSLRPLMSGFTESSLTATTASTIAIWTQSDWDSFLTSLEVHDCPDFVMNFMKPFLFFIRMSDGYEKAGLPIPPSYFVPIAHRMTLAQAQAERESAKIVAGNAMTHCRKYGIPFSKFSLDKLKSREVTRDNVFNDQTILSFLSICPFKYTWKTGPTVKVREQSAMLTGANLIADYTAINYIFDDKQDMSIMTALFPLFGSTYHVDNNPYAEIISIFSPAATEYHSSFLCVKNLGTSWTISLFSATTRPRFVARLFAAYWNADANLGPQWSGAETTAAQTMDVVDWIAFDENKNICLDTGHVRGAEALDQCILAAKSMMYGE